MKGLDTNVLLRLLLDDDPEQSARARAYVQRESKRSRCWVNRIVLCESLWVMERVYGFDRSQLADTVHYLLLADELAIEDVEIVRSALYAYRVSGADFADCLVGMSNGFHGCERTATFDRKAGRLDEFELV